MFKLDKRKGVPFWTGVNRGKDYECWEWSGDVDVMSGFGVSKRVIQGVPLERYAHRLAYLLTFGAIPHNHSIRHKCRNRLCCNPNHLIAMRKHDDPSEDAYITALFYEGRRSPFLSSFEKRRIATLRAEGYKIREISDHFGVSKSTISRVLRRSNADTKEGS